MQLESRIFTHAHKWLNILISDMRAFIVNFQSACFFSVFPVLLRPEATGFAINMRPREK